MYALIGQDVIHKNYLLRLLKEILSDNFLANSLMFKGGTYATLTDSLDRFSVDLDFDLCDRKRKNDIRDKCHKIFKELDYDIKDESKEQLQFFLRYRAKENERNTIKLEINDSPSISNVYIKAHLMELNMYCNGHDKATMFANKLVAAKARYSRNSKIAGRDFYDIHSFFEKGFPINKLVIEDLTKLAYKDYISSLMEFISSKVTDRLLLEDLNPLIEPQRLKKLIPHILSELKSFLSVELTR